MLNLFGDIDYYAVSAEMVSRELDSNPDIPVVVNINSYGGSVFEGIAIYNMLRARDVTVNVLGVAASIASLIAMAGKTLHMQEGALLMIHNSWVFVMGNAMELTKTSALLAKIDGQMANVYATRSGADIDDVKTAMTEETWYTAEEAVEAGLADEVTETELEPEPDTEMPIDASLLANYRNTPKHLYKPQPTKPANSVNTENAELLAELHKLKSTIGK